MSIWIPRSTSGFTSSDGSIKIDGVCYRAIQKNITKNQAPTSETYNPSSHGGLGSKHANCIECGSATAQWAALFWLNDTCGDGYSIPGFGTWMGHFLPQPSNWDYSNPNSTEYYSPGVPDFLDELISRRTSLSRIVENPTVTSFSQTFDMPAPNDASSNYYDWQTSASCISTEGAIGATWKLWFLYPDGMYNTFTNNGGTITPQSTPAFLYKGENYKLSNLAAGQGRQLRPTNPRIYLHLKWAQNFHSPLD